MNCHRPVIMGVQGMAATGHPLASAAALDLLKEGGNAFDAALCASAVLSVVKSYHCGVGGDAFGIFYSANERKVLVLNGSGRSPRLLPRELFSETIPHHGALAASTPGTVDAWVEMANRLGTRSLGDLLKPAIDYAKNGFPVFPHLRSVIQASHETLGADPSWAKVFLLDGSIPALGELLVQNDLAVTLGEIARGGRGAFYSGEIAKLIVDATQRRGGYFSQADFADHRSRWEEPLCATYGGYEISVPPPNSFGMLLLLQLKILAGYELARYRHNSPEYVLLQVKAKEQAYRAGEFWIADPDQFRREDLVDWLKAFPKGTGAGHSSPAMPDRGGSTTYIATADKFGNWASLIQSVHQSFGCGILVEKTGIVLNNRMAGFSLMRGHPNEIAPGKLPAHTLSPVLVLSANKPVLAIGTPGGLGQTQFLAQLLCNLFDFHMNIQEAIEAPRWQSEIPGHVELESRFSTDVSDSLTTEGYSVRVRGPWEFAFGGVEAVRLHSNGKVFLAGADPRREGYAMGY